VSGAGVGAPAAGRSTGEAAHAAEVSGARCGASGGATVAVRSWPQRPLSPQARGNGASPP
jgi:hypothetical protein